MNDLVSISGLHVQARLLDSWSRLRVQPIQINIMCRPNSRFSKTDALSTLLINYSKLQKDISNFVNNASFKNIHLLANLIAIFVLNINTNIAYLELEIKKPRAYLLVDSATILVKKSRDSLLPLVDDVLVIENFRLNSVIGINHFERQEEQRLCLSITMNLKHIKLEDLNVRECLNRIKSLVEFGKFRTLEALCCQISEFILSGYRLIEVNVQIEKPNAVTFAENSCVSVKRSRSDFGLGPINSSLSPPLEQNIVYISLGSNLEPRVNNIETAINSMKKFSNLIDTSFLYESIPMYLTEQPKFINCVVKISTKLTPMELLAELQLIEKGLGRVCLDSRVKNGPREVDLDILYYNDLVIDTVDLKIPHPLLQEREFVLRPLVDIDPSLEHPTIYRNQEQMLNSQLYNQQIANEDSTLLQKSTDDVIIKDSNIIKDSVTKVVPIGKKLFNFETGPTILMGILNITPDSFSDGNDLLTPPTTDNPNQQHPNLDKILQRATSMCNSGVGILDIGGQSTRPGAIECTIQEELDRVLPCIKAIRSSPNPQINSIPISIDTYRVEVARQCIQAGADLINDVTGGFGFIVEDTLKTASEMTRFWAEAGCTVCIMHMKGSPLTMQGLTSTYAGGDVVGGVKQSLCRRVESAFGCGVFRWRVLVDPGIGFAKDAKQNWELIRGLGDLNGVGSLLTGIPLLVGVSRKKFIGVAVGSEDARDMSRVWGSAAANTLLVSFGANVIRVHDVEEMSAVVKVADRIRML